MGKSKNLNRDLRPKKGRNFSKKVKKRTAPWPNPPLTLAEATDRFTNPGLLCVFLIDVANYFIRK